MGPTTLLTTPSAVLIGHEDWVHSVRFRPQASKGPSSNEGPPDLLSCSMDRTMVLWRQEVTTGLWLSESSFGDAGARWVANNVYDMYEPYISFFVV